MGCVPAGATYHPEDNNAVWSQSIGLLQRRNCQQMLIYDAGPERQCERCTCYVSLFGTEKCSRHTMFWPGIFFLHMYQNGAALQMSLSVNYAVRFARPFHRCSRSLACSHSSPSYTLLLGFWGCDSRHLPDGSWSGLTGWFLPWWRRWVLEGCGPSCPGLLVSITGFSDLLAKTRFDIHVHQH